MDMDMTGGGGTVHDGHTHTPIQYVYGSVDLWSCGCVGMWISISTLDMDTDMARRGGLLYVTAISLIV